MGSHEGIVRIRMVETFQLYNLGLQAWVHYAPDDSPSHITEKVMRSLSEHARDGKTVKLPEIPLTELEDNGIFWNISQYQIDTLAKMQEKLVSEMCAS